MTRGYGSEIVEKVGEIIQDVLRGKELYGQEIYRLVKERKKQASTYESFYSNILNWKLLM